MPLRHQNTKSHKGNKKCMLVLVILRALESLWQEILSCPEIGLQKSKQNSGRVTTMKSIHQLPRPFPKEPVGEVGAQRIIEQKTIT